MICYTGFSELSNVIYKLFYIYIIRRGGRRGHRFYLPRKEAITTGSVYIRRLSLRLCPDREGEKPQG